ncbi:MAG: hypothetical protein ACRCSK_08595, partial [Fusobacteriaceae bacterium]
DGAKDFIGVAFLLSFAKGIVIIMTDGEIIATVLHFGETNLVNLGQIPFIILTYLFYIPMGFLIPSMMGLATITMPIFSPLSTMAQVPKELVVTAFQSGGGIISLVAPTSVAVVGALALLRINYLTWIKFSFKFLAVIFVTTILSLIAGVILS